MKTGSQPILDVLDYKISELENVPDVVMIEGKNDFFTLRLMQKLLAHTGNINLMPGAGAGNLDDVIRLYVGWSRDFVIVLDSDGAGTNQKQRYEDLFGTTVKGRIFCLKDIDASWGGAMEGLFDQPDRIALQKLTYPADEKYNKSHFNRAVQELLATGQKCEISKNTKENFARLFEFLTEQLKEN